MAGTAPPLPFDAARFAALMAGFDIGNASEAEAMNKGRAMRRMAAAAGLRLVDALERADVKQALDAQLQPIREDSQELKDAFAKIAELAKTLADERESGARQARAIEAQLQQAQAKTAELSAALERQQDRVLELTNQLADADYLPIDPDTGSDYGLVNGGLVTAVILIAAALLATAIVETVK